MLSALTRPDPHPRGAAQSDSALQEQEEEILGSDDEEQEDPNDYCKGKPRITLDLLWGIKCPSRSVDQNLSTCDIRVDRSTDG